VIPDLEDLDIKDGDVVAVDLETHDPDLKTHGSGAIIGKGKVCGVALAYRDEKYYFPIGHLHSGQNIGKNSLWKHLNKILFQNKKVTKVFHNAMYDVCWIRAATGMMLKGPVYDTMIAASVIDENRPKYSLDALAKDYLNDNKYKYDLADKAKELHGISDPMTNMHKLPYDLVVDYAEQDVSLTLRLWNKFEKIIKTPVNTESKNKKTLENIFDIETRLFPCLVEMRFLGVRVDEEKAKTFGDTLKKEQAEILKIIKKETGLDIDIWAADSIQPLLDHQKITDYKITPKTGRASITKLYLESHTNKYLKMIAKARQLDKLFNTFVSGILKFIHKGRIHADINQIRSDQGGTVTGRFSMRNPNLQQIPARSELGSKIRELFLPEENHKWGSFELEDDEAKELFEKYHSQVPFVRKLSQGLQDFAEKNKNIYTLEDRFCRFDKWEPVNKEWNPEKGIFEISDYQEIDGKKQIVKIPVPILKRDEAENRYHAEKAKNRHESDPHGQYFEKHYRPAFTYKALNRLIQGSAADMTKKAMVDLYEQGIVPHIQIHDELCFSIKNDEQAKKIKFIMENAIKLKVPNKVDYESGPNWGTIK
jgi:DNA polymerase-1